MVMCLLILFGNRIVLPTIMLIIMNAPLQTVYSCKNQYGVLPPTLVAPSSSQLHRALSDYTQAI